MDTSARISRSSRDCQLADSAQPFHQLHNHDSALKVDRLDHLRDRGQQQLFLAWCQDLVDVVGARLPDGADYAEFLAGNGLHAQTLDLVDKIFAGRQHYGVFDGNFDVVFLKLKGAVGVVDAAQLQQGEATMQPGRFGLKFDTADKNALQLTEALWKIRFDQDFELAVEPEWTRHGADEQPFGALHYLISSVTR